MNLQKNGSKPSVSFRFLNIGPVRDATLELGDLTVISGRNNTGKTYIVYSLYGFLSGWAGASFLASTLLKRDGELSEIKAICDGIISDGEAVIPITPRKIALQRNVLAKFVSDRFAPNIKDVFSSDRDNFRDAQIRTTINAAHELSAPSPVRTRLGRSSIAMRYDDRHIIATLNSRKSLPSRMHNEACVYAYLRFLLRDVLPDPFILSAERFGISLFYRELDFTKNQIVDLLQKHVSDENIRSPFFFIDRTASRYATPIKHNIDFTRSVPDLPRDPSSIAEHKLHDHVKNMMQGYYSNTSNEIRFISKARKKNRFNIPLHLASSSARGLCDLYFFLRYAADQDRLLIIDEPESHLDTANQVEFARLLARFVGAGLRALITTHSDYIVKELNNLIMLSRDFSQKRKVARKLGYRVEDALHPDRVRAYVAESGGLTECRIGPYGIEAPVFDETIDAINLRSIELSSRMPVRTR